MKLLRPLISGESLRVPPELVTRFGRFYRSRRDAPPSADRRSWLIAERGGQLYGWIDLDHLYDDVFAVREVAAVGPQGARLGLAMLEDVVQEFSGGRLEAATWSSASDPLLDWLIERPVGGGRFELYVEKVYVRRSLVDYAPPPDPFTGLGVDQVPAELFQETFAAALAGSFNRDLRQDDPAAELAEMRAIEGASHDPSLWEIVLLDGEIIGIILGNRFPLDPKEGTVTFIGTVQRARGRGLGKLLHARAMAKLAASGATAYLCSTDVCNAPMIALYRANGCETVGYRRQFVWCPATP